MILLTKVLAQPVEKIRLLVPVIANYKLQDMKRHGFDLQLDVSGVFSKLNVNVNLAGYTAPSTPEAFIRIVEYCRQENIPFYVIGNMSKSLPLTNGSSLVIDTRRLKELRIDPVENVLHVQSGALLNTVAGFTARNQFSNFEFSVDIPGAIGASLRNDAQFPRIPSMIVNVHEQLGDDINIRLRDILINATIMDETNNIYTSSNISDLANLSLDSFILEASFRLKLADAQHIGKSLTTIEQLRSRNRYTGIDEAHRQQVGQSLGHTFKVLRYTIDGVGTVFTDQLLQIFQADNLALGGIKQIPNIPAALYNNGKGTPEQFIGLVEMIENKILKDAGVNLTRNFRVIP